MDGNRIDELALAHLDGRLDDEAFAELQALLDSDPAARAEYARYARLDAELRDEGLADLLRENVVEFPDSPTRVAAGPILLAVAAVMAALAVPAWMFLSGDRGSVDPGTVETEIPARATTRGIAVITAEAGAVWGEMKGNIVPREGASLEPCRLVLSEGLAQIDFFGGASISLSGPAELELVSRDAAVLHRGRLRADVPPAARGFEIRSGEVLVEDLGTSFGLAVGDEDSAELIVFDGEVRATGTDGKPMSLFGGDAAHLEKGAAVRQSPEAAGEFPNIEDVIAGSGSRDKSKYAVWKAASVERRSDPRLIAYYDFEDLTVATRRLKNRATAGEGAELDGGIVGARVTQGRWGPKTALDFRLEGDRVRFQIPGDFAALTIYAWVRIDALDRHLNSLFLTEYYDEREFHWQLSDKGMLHFATSPDGVDDLVKNNRRFYSDAFWNPAKSGQWFLLATTVDPSGGGVTHYVNGEKIGFSGGTNMEKPLHVLRIGEADLGNWSDPIWPTAIRTLNGRIDEFALFDEVLSAEEIHKIHEQGKP